MKQLNSEVKTYVVQQLAIGESPQQVVDGIFKKFGILVTRQQVNHYDASKPYYQGGAKWKELFENTRSAYFDTVIEDVIAQKHYRFRVLQELLDEQLNKSNRDTYLILKILERASKECRLNSSTSESGNGG